MKGAELISNAQLAALHRNSRLDKSLRSQIASEISRRKIDAGTVETCKFGVGEKMEVIFTCLFFYQRHLSASTRFIVNGDINRYRAYWKCFMYGVGFYSLLFLIIVKLGLNLK